MTDRENGVKELGPWLLNIQARAPGSPVVIVGTHLDRIKGETEKELQKQEFISMIHEKYPFEGNANHSVCLISKMYVSLVARSTVNRRAWLSSDRLCMT